MTSRGWCPSLYEPMPTGDGLLVRVKPRGSVLTAAQARLIAGQAGSFGNGVIELTSRANLQLRGFSRDGVGPFARAIAAAGLASTDPAAERRRNVIATPLADIDPSANPATAVITAALETALETDTALASLPAKFGLLVDGGGLLPVPARADIRLSLFGDQAEVACDHDVSLVPLGNAVAAALARAHALCLGETVGVRVFGEQRPRRSRGAPGPIGAIGAIAFGAGLPFGSATARVWSALADLAERYGDGKVRLTPWRAVLIARAAPEILRAAFADLDLITDPDDPRLRVAACPGQPGCAAASVATRALASRLRPPGGITVHVSGCDKGCAHPGAASVTLVGRDGGFDLVRDGRAGDTPARHGLSPDAVLAL